MSVNRRPIRANQWYEGDPTKLVRYVEGTLQNAADLMAQEKAQHPATGATVGDKDHLVGLVGPHAGLSYCGDTSGCAYAKLRQYLYRPTSSGVEGDKIRRILLMGPSHAKYFNGVMFPSSTSYGTPLGDLNVDTASQKELESLCQISKVPSTWMSQKEDEAEHSLELHTPYIAHLLHNGSDGKRHAPGAKTLGHIQIVPMVVGDMDTAMEAKFGEVLSHALGQPDTLFIISSDFCHWGERFRFTHKYDKLGGAPADMIERMDRTAMQIIQENDTSGWASYMGKTQNTICGRHAISSFMFAAENARSNGGAKVTGGSCLNTEFLHYSQSSRCESPSDSSVSYASCVFARK